MMQTEKEFLSDYAPIDVEAVVGSELNHAAKYKSHPKPIAVLLAGQPGAGKTVLSAMLNKLLHDDVYFINGDEYRRFHPNYRKLFDTYGSDSVQMTSKFSGEVTERLIQQIADRKVNLIIEGTGRTTEIPHKTAKALTEKGYRVELAVIATRPEQSLCSTLLRFYEMNEGGTIPRATAAEAHDYIVNMLPGNLDTLYNDSMISKITIWDRTPERVYDSEMDYESPSEALREYWFRPWSDEEYRHITQIVDLLRGKEAQYHLGQSAAIDELERRVQNISSDLEHSFDNLSL